MKITFTDKTLIDNRPDLSDVEKITGGNINEIKNVVNVNADELESTKVKTENLSTEVEALKQKDTAQDKNIQKNAKDIEVNQNNIKALQVENAEVKAENERLRSDIESISLLGEAEGESIDLEDSSGARFKKFGIGGNHKQETREGYNLLDFNVTQDGRVKVNKEGTIIINGTGGFTLAFKQFTAKANTKYYIKWELVSGTVDTSKSNGNSFLSPLDNTNIKQSEFKENVVENDKNINGFWVNNMTVFTNAVIKFWANTNKSDFEQYGASPSPDYPSEVETVGGNINIFNKNDVMENAYLNSANGSTLSSSTSVTSNYIEINSNSNYVINGYGTNNYYKVVCYYDKNKNFISSITKTDTSNKLEISAPDGACYLRFNISKNSEEVKLEKGSIITSYSQYNQGSVEVKVVNKNFVKIDETIDFSISNVQFTCKDGKLNLNGTSNTNISSVNNNFKNYFRFILPAGNYTYSQKNSVSSDIFTYILDFEDTSKRYATANGNSVKNASFTLEKTTEVFVGVYSGSNVTFNNVKIELQIERGSTTTDFVEHQEQTITMPVQQEMLQGDYFDWVNEKEVHKWNLLSFTGNEAWSLLSGATSVFLLENVSGQTYGGHNFSMCTHFKYDTRVGGMANLQDETFAMQYEYSALYVKCNKFTTVEEWKAYLKSQYENGTPIKLAYITSNITKLSFTGEQKAVAKKRKETLHTYKNITHIYSTDETNPIMNVEYAKDLNTVINNMQAQIINNASEEVNG